MTKGNGLASFMGKLGKDPLILADPLHMKPVGTVTIDLSCKIREMLGGPLDVC
jgi:hypothetical protein